MTPRTRWQGWTIVDEDGNLVLDLNANVPLIYPSKVQAFEDKQDSERVVRCELSIKPAARKKERK